ncbi:MAG: fimbrillin family protein, partial [Rikenellaceae bacterium]|nr:fimbrillin family protein [Rikenellaceae bacterium]
MKYRFTKQVLAAISALAVFACTKTDADGPLGGGSDGDLVPAVITAGIGSGTTRAHDAEWDDNDAIGLAMLMNGELINDAYNYHYVSSQQRGVFEPNSADMTVYFPADGSGVNFRGYYPYYSALDETMTVPIDVADQTTLPDIDFMSAELTPEYSKRDPVVRLSFYHRLTKLVFKLSGENQEAFGSLEDCTLTIDGMKTTGTFALLDEELTVAIGSDAQLPFPIRGGAEERYGSVRPS